MQLKRLTLTQFRVFEQAEFEFQPGMNLLVGINGAGKSTVLDVLRIMLSQALPKLTLSRSKSISFSERDIKVGSRFLDLYLALEIGNNPLNYQVHINHEKKDDESTEQLIRRQAYSLPKHGVFSTSHPIAIRKEIIVADEQPFATYFSTRRSLPIMDAPSKASIAGGQAAAFADALSHRELRLSEFTDWWLSQEALAEETEGARFGRNLRVLSDTVMHFLDDCTNLRAIREPQVTLLVDKRGKTLDLRQLSDGERSMIALVLDLARRLALANPKLTDPLRDGKAIVLIDELDLHLHPRWQREIVNKLTSTFPNCQFIATTHSPQIVGEVSPDNIIMIEDGKAYRPNQSLGMDTNWILRHLMDTSVRSREAEVELARIEALIEDEKYEEADAAIDLLRRNNQEDAKLVDLQTRIDMIAFLSEQLDDETSELHSEDEGQA